jgi:hypothetical protein
VSPHAIREMLCLATIIYNIFILPFRWAFLNDYDNTVGWSVFFALDYGTDLVRTYYFDGSY